MGNGAVGTVEGPKDGRPEVGKGGRCWWTGGLKMTYGVFFGVNIDILDFFRCFQYQ